ncbi:MAG: SIR2 family protein [Caldilineaceae bacterium]
MAFETIVIDKEEASEIIEDFKAEFGQAHLHLAYHAAFPLMLNPDLLYHIWANFQWDLQGNHLDIPWFAVADVLLSPMCSEVAHETYAMETAVRDQLLAAMARDSHFQQAGRGRLQELGQFLEQYALRDLNSARTSVREQAEAQQWNALAFYQPQRLNEAIGRKYQTAVTKPAEHLRMANLLQTFNLSFSTWAQPDDETAAKFQEFVTYSRGWANHLRKRPDDARSEFATYLGAVSAADALPIPAEILQQVQTKAPEPFVEPAKGPVTKGGSLRSRRLQQERQSDELILTNLVRQIRRQQCLPIIHIPFLNYAPEALLAAYADYIAYPLAKSDPLERMTQVHQLLSSHIMDSLWLKQDFLGFLKNLAFDEAERRNVSKEILTEVEEIFDSISCSQLLRMLDIDAKEPYLVQLVELPFPIYVTTSYHGVLEDALLRAGKKPIVECCRWNVELEDLPSALDDGQYAPSVDEPLVYHLYGVDEHPTSLVLTEQDYMTFLKETARNQDVIPAVVKAAIASRSTLLLNYQQGQLPFRILQTVLNRHRVSQYRFANIIQHGQRFDEVEEQAFVNYWERNRFHVYWGNHTALVSEIHKFWQSS